MAVSASEPGQPHWRDVVPERRDASIESVSFGRATIAVTYLKNASTVIEIFDPAGRPIGTINQPGIGAATISADEDRADAYMTYASFNYPPTVFRVDLTSPGAAPARWKAPHVPIDPGDRGRRAGLVSVERRNEDQHVPGAQERVHANGKHAGAARRLRRLQGPHGAGVFGDAAAMVRRGRPPRRAEPARRRGVRRRVARGRTAGSEADGVRRLHCGRRVADRQQVHERAEARDSWRLERRAAHRRGDHAASRSVSRGARPRPAARHAAVSQVRARAVLGRRVRLVRRCRCS